VFKVADIKIFNPPELGTPLGQYSQIARVKASEFIFIAGQVGARSEGTIAEGFEAQCAQAFANTLTALESCGANWANVVQFTTYLVHSQDISRFMDYRLREFPKMFRGNPYPPNTLLMIDRLVKESLLFEVHTIAAL
jgi:enamine deaminase RidA (YjgF/YER057c/UK114 family)